MFEKNTFNSIEHSLKLIKIAVYVSIKLILHLENVIKNIVAFNFEQTSIKENNLLQDVNSIREMNHWL